MDGPAQGEILTPIPRPVSSTWTARICTSDSIGADPSYPIEVDGAYSGAGRKYPLTPRWPQAAP